MPVQKASLESFEDSNAGFTLLETLVSLCIVAVVSVLIFTGVSAGRKAGARAADMTILRNLQVASALYAAENEKYWKYREDTVDGTQYWFGYETAESSRRAEGKREYDPSRSPLGPYMAGAQSISSSLISGGVKFKPKYKTGYMAVGYNSELGDKQIRQVPSGTVLFATSAQINTLQKPASKKNPMLEEFYYLQRKEYTAHYRHGGECLIITTNGIAHFVPLEKGLQDTRVPQAEVGKLPLKWFQPEP